MPLSRADQARVNGAKSHGPVTTGGKARSSLNALKHGRYATNAVVLSNEDADALEELVASYVCRIQPTDPVEYSLTRELASIDWRLTRVFALDTRMLDREMAIQLPAYATAGLSLSELTRLLDASRSIVDRSKLPAYLARREAQLINARRSILAVLKDLRKNFPSSDPAPEVVLPQPLDPDSLIPSEPGTNPPESGAGPNGGAGLQTRAGSPEPASNNSSPKIASSNSSPQPASEDASPEPAPEPTSPNPTHLVLTTSTIPLSPAATAQPLQESHQANSGPTLQSCPASDNASLTTAPAAPFPAPAKSSSAGLGATSESLRDRSAASPVRLSGSPEPANSASTDASPEPSPAPTSPSPAHRLPVASGIPFSPASGIAPLAAAPNSGPLHCSPGAASDGSALDTASISVSRPAAPLTGSAPVDLSGGRLDGRRSEPEALCEAVPPLPEAA